MKSKVLSSLSIVLVLAGLSLMGRALVVMPNVYLEPITLQKTPLNPVAFVSLPQDANFSYLLEKSGRVNLVNMPTGEVTEVLDLLSDVSSSGNEDGLLSLVFDPKFSEGHPYIYLYYTTAQPRLRNVLRRYHVFIEDNYKIDSEYLEIISIDKPGANHNGGGMFFNPEDGYLYLSIGDGYLSKAERPLLQTRTTLLGSVIRIDVSISSKEAPYQVPADNPFVADSKKEIFAYGLRNTWRLSYDPVEKKILGMDVGSDFYEELNEILPGKNYGWPVSEGARCNADDQQSCQKLFEAPVKYFDRDTTTASVGGYIYRGKDYQGYYGKYFFADYSRAIIYFIDLTSKKTTKVWSKIRTLSGNNKGKAMRISSFCQANQQELCVIDYNGSIYFSKPMNTLNWIKLFAFSIWNFQ